jgi:hypothetical protein
MLTDARDEVVHSPWELEIHFVNRARRGTILDIRLGFGISIPTMASPDPILGIK